MKKRTLVNVYKKKGSESDSVTGMLNNTNHVHCKGGRTKAELTMARFSLRRIYHYRDTSEKGEYVMKAKT